MERLWSWTVAFARFWYDFVIGDDWVGAVGVLVLIGGTWALVATGVPAFWFGPLVIVLTAGVLVGRGLRRADTG